MRNAELATDYVRRAAVRLRAIDVLFEAESWADVVREAQEVVELALKGLLLAERTRLPAGVRGDVERLGSISKDLRRDRELAFCGAEDLTPSTFYTRPDAVRALDGARHVVRLVGSVVPPR